MAVATERRGVVRRPQPPLEATGASSAPVKVWASIGAGVLAFQLYIWIKWVSGPNFERVPVGPDQPPSSMKITIWVGLSMGFFLAAYCLYRFVWRPWRREGRLSLDGMMTLGFLLAYFQDPLFNYSGTWLTYNSYMPNWGSWLSEMPGSLAPAAPGAQFAESPLWVAPLFVYILLPVCLLMGRIMDRARRRWPTITTTRLVLLAWLFTATFTLVLEAAVLMPLGFYTYAGAFADTSVNPSHFYKYPVYEAVLWGAAWTAWGCLRYFRNDRGETFAERGIERLRLTGARATGIRFLAVFGAISVIFLCVYNIPAQYMGPRAVPFPKDVQERSYFLNGLCGEGTKEECARLNRAAPGS
jgi:Spirocyclase AveC-like